MNTPFRYFPLLLLLMRCGEATDTKPQAKIPSSQIQETSLKRGVVETRIIIRQIPTESYCLYIPAGGDTAGAASILFFDPKGDGCIPVKKYQSIADKYNLILAGSNNSKNGLNAVQSADIVRNFVNELVTRLQLSREKIIVCGFSGGARVAVQAAVRESLNGVIGCGAGFPGEPDRKFGFSYIGMAGNEDFNYLEMKRLDKKLEQLGMNHQLLVFNGEHEWASAKQLEIAFRSMNELKSGRKISENKEIMELAAKNFVYPLLLNEESGIEISELQQQAEIAQLFSRQEFTKIDTEIETLQAKASKKSNEQTLSDKRLLNFISLLGFLYSEKALSADLEIAKQFLDLYGKADSDNPDYYYLMAYYYSMSQKKDEAIAALKKSVENGNSDYQKILGNSAFQSVQEDSVFKSLIQEMKVASELTYPADL